MTVAAIATAADYPDAAQCPAAVSARAALLAASWTADLRGQHAAGLPSAGHTVDVLTQRPPMDDERRQHRSDDNDRDDYR
ncbi:hypothetical protein ACFYO1_08810 [Nocardia sp. NPDC006044]|uniref:hypothetical protein n=1 Tax=Nocardia sp. NPDC006044 TaxID=3364306 RepID=UPI00367B33B8